MAYHVMDEANRCLQCKVPQCQKGCPIGTNIPEAIRSLKTDRVDYEWLLNYGFKVIGDTKTKKEETKNQQKVTKVEDELKKKKEELEKLKSGKNDKTLLNLENYVVEIDNIPLRLTKKEIEILWTLSNNSNKVFSRDSLLDKLWGYDFYGDSRTVDSHIKRLRAKLDEHPHQGWEIETIWGVGYKFEVL